MLVLELQQQKTRAWVFQEPKLQKNRLKKQFLSAGLVENGQTRFGNSNNDFEEQILVFEMIKLSIPWED